MKYMPNHKKIMLILTENCNLRCRYCYEIDKNRCNMTFETAKHIISSSLSHMEGFSTAEIEFHVGEPLLMFDLIKKVDAFVRENYHFPILFRMITNGTLLNDEMKKFFAERKDSYEIMLSLDGKADSHNRNRITVNGQGSFDLIDFNFFTKTWPHCPVSMTVSESTIDSLAENTIWIQEQGFDCLNAFQWATTWNLEKCYPILQRELEKLVEYYTNHPEMHTCLLMNYDFSKIDETIDDNFRYCVEIDDPLECYDAEGRYAPCHGFTEFTVGSKEKAEEFKDKSIRDFKIEPRNICYGCRLIKLCRVCFAANHMLSGDMQIQNREICIFNQLCILEGAKVELNRDRLYEDKKLSDAYKAAIQSTIDIISEKGDVKA